MAFTQNTFATVGAHSADTPNLYSYKSADTLADIKAIDYFAPKINQVNTGDFVQLNASDSSTILVFSVVGQVITAQSASFFNPSTGMAIERVLEGKSLANNQQPNGQGENNSIQVEFGVAQFDSSDPVNLLSNGRVNINESGTYRVKGSFAYGRTGSSGQAFLRIRTLVNGSQPEETVGINIIGDSTITPYADSVWLFLPAGTNVKFQVIRDSSGNNSGGLFKPSIDGGSSPDWNQCSCAVIRIDRWIST